MKGFLTAAGLLIATMGFAQTSSIVCRAAWRNQEEKTYQITHTTRNYSTDRLQSEFSVSYNARVRITDSSKDGYSFTWSLYFPGWYKMAHPEIVSAMQDYISMKYKYTTGPNGNFIRLNNWEEIRDVYVKMMMVSMPKNPNDTVKAGLSKAISLFNTPDAVAGTLIREVQIFHAVYGGEFNTEGTHKPVATENPFGGGPVPAIISQQLTGYYPDKNFYTLELSYQLDSTGARPLVNGMINKLNLTDEKRKQEFELIMNSLRMNDRSVYTIRLPEHWITEASRTRTAYNGHIRKTDTYFIKLLNVTE